MSARHLTSIIPALPLLALSATIDARPVFTAYNDIVSSVAGEYDNTNVTYWTLGDANELLTDYATGNQPGYMISVTGDPAGDANVSSTTANGYQPDIGTDAYSVFGDIVNMVSYIQGNNGAGYVDLTFTGLSSELSYEVVLYGERSPATDGRPTQFTISGADAFINASTMGAIFSGATDPSVIYDTAPNDTPGYVARFTKIRAGTDGTFSVRVDDGDTGTSNWYVNALRFSEVPVPGPLALIGLGLVGLVGLGRRNRRR